MTELSRRQLLVGGTALAFLTACSDDGGGGGGDDAGPDPTTPSTTGGAGGSVLLVLLPQQGVLTTSGPQRVPLAVAGPDGVPIREDLPTRTFQVRTDAGEPIELEVEPHGDGIPTPYYPVIFTPESTGIHEITVVGEEFNAVTFDIGESSAIPSIGQPQPPLDTPTVEHDQGVTPICTRDPACDLHAISLREALAAGGPIALSIATPEFCQTAICGPVLDLLIEALPDHPTVTGIHAEVYADPRGNADPTAGGLAPIAEEYALPFEPTLYLVDASGQIVNRLDSVFDRVELREALAQIS
jgi:hypothetical protein